MYQKVLVPLDGSQLAECVLPHVNAIAGGCGVKSVIFARVVEPFVPPVTGGEAFNAQDLEKIEQSNEAEVRQYLASLRSRISYNGTNTQSVMLYGRVAETITEYADKNGIDLIIIATHGRSGVSRWVWGSVADRILRSICVPVLMVRAPGCFPGV